jgi:hypothetical protein
MKSRLALLAVSLGAIVFVGPGGAVPPSTPARTVTLPQSQRAVLDPMHLAEALASKKEEK